MALRMASSSVGAEITLYHPLDYSPFIKSQHASRN
jgi:hypothetical protein